MISEAVGDSIDYVWTHFRPQIQKALYNGAGDTTTEETLYRATKAGDVLMWVIHEGDDIHACALLSVKQYPAKRTLYVELLAGESMDDWLAELEDTLEQYRIAIEANTIEACCRRGLAKRLSRWRTKAVLMEFTG